MRQKPVALQLAEETKPVEIVGRYDATTDTWSDREYASASDKKHHEQN